MNDIRRRYGNYTNPEVIADDDLVYGEFEELDKDGNVKEGGVKNKSSLALDLIKNKTAKKKILGLKKDDEVDIDISKHLKTIMKFHICLLLRNPELMN